MENTMQLDLENPSIATLLELIARLVTRVAELEKITAHLRPE